MIPLATQQTTYVIWSDQYKAWWRPNGEGYVLALRDAGVYSHADAERWAAKSRFSSALTLEEALDTHGTPRATDAGTVGAMIDAHVMQVAA